MGVGLHEAPPLLEALLGVNGCWERSPFLQGCCHWQVIHAHDSNAILIKFNKSQKDGGGGHGIRRETSWEEGLKQEKEGQGEKR